jgi:LuxR family maltose regulon positive regulatory protein
MGSAIEALVLQALAHEARGNQSAALISLERAMALAAPQDYVRIFLDEGLPMNGLLNRAGARGIVPHYTGRLLQAFRSEKQHPAAAPIQATPSTQPLIEPLSPRELEVLELLAQGLSNREVAERLFLALSTVKGHNSRIYGKLQVRRRTEAVARARELGLL